VRSSQPFLFRFFVVAGDSKSIKFGVLAPQEIHQLSEFEVVNRELYQVPSREPMPNGCLDPRLVRSATATTVA